MLSFSLILLAIMVANMCFIRSAVRNVKNPKIVTQQINDLCLVTKVFVQNDI